MTATFTLEYWQNGGGFVGRLKEVPGVFSQGDTLEQLEDNIADAYALVIADLPPTPVTPVRTKLIRKQLGLPR